jgi:hypothetical protein
MRLGGDSNAALAVTLIRCALAGSGLGALGANAGQLVYTQIHARAWRCTPLQMEVVGYNLPNKPNVRDFVFSLSPRC